MTRWLKMICMVIFLVICAGVGWFLLQFTESAPPFDYLVWEEGAVVAADGSETAFDASGIAPQLEEGETLRYALTLPQGRTSGEWLIFETAGLECAVLLDGEEIWYSHAVQEADTANMSQAQLPLPEGGGEELSMTLRQTGEVAMVPPLLRLALDPTDQAGAIAYANHYGIPAGLLGLALALMCGLFLLGLVHGKRNLRLLLPILAAAVLLLHNLCVGFGDDFLPQWVVLCFGAHWVTFVAPVALLLYLVLHRERAFWKDLALMTFWSALALAGCYCISQARDGGLSRYLNDQLALLPQGYYDGLLYWFTLWLVLVTTLQAAQSLVRNITATKADAQALALKNRMMMENMQHLEERIRDTAAQQHETAHRLAAMDVMLRAGDLDDLAESLAGWSQDNRNASQLHFAENLAVDAILGDAAARAEAAGIDFHAEAEVPEAIGVESEDLCILLMNMLDNAIEGASRTPEDREKKIHIQLNCRNGYLAILCDNSYDGDLLSDDHGNLVSVKGDALAHGFGLAQMRRIARKYGSILDIKSDGTIFTVQTALRMRTRS